MKLADLESKTRLYYSYTRASDLPLMILALFMVPVLFAPDVFTLSPDVTAGLDVADWFIYACFASDYLVKLYLAPSKWAHIKHNWLDLLLLLLPLLRPLRLVRSARLLRLLRAARALVFLFEMLKKLNAVLSKRKLNVVLVAILAVVVAAAGLVSLFEQGAGGTIKNFGDALWWAAATVTTVGYGDAIPVTAEGRGVGVFLMITGIAFFSVLTANVAAYFVESQVETEDAGLHQKLDTLLVRLARIEEQLQRGHQQEDSPPAGEVIELEQYDTAKT